MTDKTEREAAKGRDFMELCALLPAETNWSDPITPDVVRHIRAALAQQSAPAADYAECCDAPRFCSSVRRCTAKDAIPQPVSAPSSPMTNGGFHCPQCGRLMMTPSACGHCLWEADTCGYAHPARTSVSAPAACFKCGHAQHDGSCVNVAPPAVAQAQGVTDGIKFIYDDICDERIRQDMQWGGPQHDDKHNPFDFLRFIGQQIDKSYRDTSLLPGKVRALEMPIDEVGAQTRACLRERFVKIAALAVAAIASIDRKAEIERIDRAKGGSDAD